MTAAEIDLIAAAVERRLSPRLDGMERKIDDLTEMVQGMATGHAARFDAIETRLVAHEQRFVAIEEHLGVKPPPRPAWQPSKLA